MRMLIPRRPLVGLVSCFVLGVWVGFLFPVSEVTALCTFGAATLILTLVVGSEAVGRRSGRRPTAFLMSAGVVCLCHLGAFSAGRVLAILRVAEDLAWVAPSVGIGKAVNVVGTVADDPLGDTTGPQLLTLSLQSIAVGGETPRAVKGRLSVRLAGFRGSTSPKYGQSWRVEGVLQGIERPGRGGLRAGSGTSLAWRTASRMRLLSGPGKALMLRDAQGWDQAVQKCYRLRRSSAAYLAVGIEEFRELVGLLQALLLGSRSQLSPRMREVFVATGTLHIFAISGLHVAIIGMFVVLGLRSLRVSRHRWILFLAPVLVVYTVATGASASAVRACIMGIAYFLAPYLGRKSDVHSSIAFTALVILAVDPAQLYEIGFILSFVVVAGIIFLYPYAELPFRGFFRADPMISTRVPELAPSWTWRTVRWTCRYACSLVALSIAAWFTSVPLMAYLFGRFSPIALACNIVVIPLNFLIVLTGCLSIVIGPCIGWMGDVFNHANLALIYVTVWVMEVLMAVPGGNFEEVYFSAWAVWAWYGVIGVAVIWVAARRGQGENSCGRAGEVLAFPP